MTWALFPVCVVIDYFRNEDSNLLIAFFVHRRKNRYKLLIKIAAELFTVEDSRKTQFMSTTSIYSFSIELPLISRT